MKYDHSDSRRKRNIETRYQADQSRVEEVTTRKPNVNEIKDRLTTRLLKGLAAIGVVLPIGAVKNPLAVQFLCKL